MEFRTLTRHNIGYKVSECGTVIISPKSGEPITIQDNIVKGKVSGYKYVTLLFSQQDGFMHYSVKRMPVHRLVCELWHGEPTSESPWVNHKDGNKANNHYSNLEWNSISDNIKHSFRELGRKAPIGMAGKEHKESSKMKQSIKKKGANHPKFKGWYNVYGNRYGSLQIAADDIGQYPQWVYRKIQKRAEGFFFEPIESL